MNSDPQQAAMAAAYGGDGWSPRTKSLEQEMGSLWGDWGVGLEWAPLQAVLLHQPGPEIEGLVEPNAVQMLAAVDVVRFRQQHQSLAAAYRAAGAAVHELEPDGSAPPNTLFCADLFFMTPQGAILARPASTVRAGEEVHVARRLAALRAPILLSVHGEGTFEGADAVWIGERTALVATGLRTNQAGADQVAWALKNIGAEVIHVDLPFGSMHLMGTLRLAGPEIAMGYAGRTPHRAVRALRERGYRFLWPSDADEIGRMALNFVTLGPNRILMAANCPRTQAVYEAAGIECITVHIDELAKAAGGMGCLTGILKRDQGGTKA
ncbi:MAG: dimethylarginine dimethylaminohydrolase family protein [Chloroflexota bacterium]